MIVVGKKSPMDTWLSKRFQRFSAWAALLAHCGVILLASIHHHPHITPSHQSDLIHLEDSAIDHLEHAVCGDHECEICRVLQIARNFIIKGKTFCFAENDQCFAKIPIETPIVRRVRPCFPRGPPIIL